MNNDRIMFARMLNLDYLNSFDQNQLDLSENDVTKNINNLVVTMEDNKVHLQWNDCVNPAWKKAYVVKAENSIPTSVFSGNVIESYTEKNKYSAIPLIDDQVNENTLYCYRVFYEFENNTKYYSGFKNLFYVYVTGATICNEEHDQGPVFAKNVVTDPLHRFASDTQIELWTNKSDFDGDYNSLTNKPSFANVAKTGNYNDLINKPSLATVATSGNYVHLTNKPDVYEKSEVYAKSETYNKTEVSNLIKIASKFSGNYNDLTNKPVLAPVATTGSYNDLSNTPTLSAVATSGSYKDLTNKPDVYLKTETYTKAEISELMIQANNFSGNYEDLKNIPQFAEVATSGDYAHLNNRPDVYVKTETYSKTEVDNLMRQSSNFSGRYDDLEGKPELAKVATSGSYEDLTSKPDIYQKSEVYSKDETYAKADVYSKTESYSKEQVDGLLDTIKTTIPQAVSGICKYVPEGANNGDCYVVATKPGITFRKENNKATLTVPEGTDILSIQVRFSSAEVGTSGKVIIRYGDNYNFADKMFVPTYSLIQDMPENRVYKLGQAATFGTEPNEIQLVGLSANIGVIAKLTF